MINTQSINCSFFQFCKRKTAHRLVNRSYMEVAKEEEEREGPVGMGCIFEYHITDLQYIATFVT